MKKIVEVSIILGVILGIQPATAVPVKPNITRNYDSTNNQFQAIEGTTPCKEETCFDSQTINQFPDSSEVQNSQEYANPTTETGDPRIEEIVFDFDNAYDYGICLDAILLAYENRVLELEQASKNDCAKNIFSVFGQNLSKDIALQLIQSADSYVTTELGLKLYPSLGLRRRVAINFGYIYDIDRNNNDVFQYLSSN